jgi:hypothetical protein
MDFQYSAIVPKGSTLKAGARISIEPRAGMNPAAHENYPQPGASVVARPGFFYQKQVWPAKPNY